jgi:hypothetical protein
MPAREKTMESTTPEAPPAVCWKIENMEAFPKLQFLGKQP